MKNTKKSYESDPLYRVTHALMRLVSYVSVGLMLYVILFVYTAYIFIALALSLGFFVSVLAVLYIVFRFVYIPRSLSDPNGLTFADFVHNFVVPRLLPSSKKK